MTQRAISLPKSVVKYPLFIVSIKGNRKPVLRIIAHNRYGKPHEL
jgi:hypothetical protein